MRVCQVVRQYHPSVGGLESFAAALAGTLRQLGCTSDVITLDRVFERAGPRLPVRETLNGVAVTRTSMIGVRRYFVPRLPRAQLAEYDVIHVHGLDGFYEAIARRPRGPGQALVATTHGAIFHTAWLSPLKRAYFNAVLRPLARRYDAVLATSENDAALMAGANERVIHVPDAVAPLGDFTAAGGDLLYLGRLAAHKHVERLIDALASPMLADVRLHVVGPAWDVRPEELAARAAALGVSERVMLHGVLGADQLAALARDCALFVSASRYEGFGMSMIEAMSVGLIPVVQANASFTELVDKARLGACVDFAEPQRAGAEIATQLAALSPAKRAAARAFAGRYSWDAHARRTLAVYEQALGARRSAPAPAAQVL